MTYKGNMLSKTLVIGLLILLIVMSVVYSTGNIIEHSPFNTQVLDLVDNSEELLFRRKIAYAYIADSGSSGLPEGPCYFYLDDPGNITSLKPTSSDNILTGGTWGTDGKWRGCEYGSGCLWEIDHETGDMLSIGGGGTSCNGLSWDIVYTRLYATDGSNLIEYDPETGEQEFIGSHGQPGTMIGLAINYQGVCYAWNVLFNGTSTLFTVDLETCETTEVASMGENLNGTGDGAFDWHTDILYLSASGQLKTCDVETGELTLIGDFEGDAKLTALAIPFHCGFPQAKFVWTPILPNPGEMIFFDASDSYDQNGYITLYSWDWDNDGIFDENHTSPTSTHTFDEVGYYPVTLRVKDNDNWTVDKTKTVRVGNQPPYEPSNPYPPGDFPVPIDINLSWDGGDPDPEDTVTYDVFFGSDHPSYVATVGPYPANQKRIHYDPGTLALFEMYYWRIVAWDNHGASTPGQTWSFATGINLPPTDPKINGPDCGVPGLDYNFTFISTDPENNTIKYFVDWGDGTNSETGYHASGKVITLNHTWKEKGTYIIRVEAEDQYGERGESEHKINIPRTRASNLNLLSWLLERYPLLEVFLRAMNLLR